MESALFALAVLPGLAVPLLMHVARLRVLSREPSRPAGPPLPVSILKPLKGLDPALERNLESFFRLDHPHYELVLGAADADDPALDVARRVAARHPHVRATVVADARRVGPNPKVSNLANLLRRARHEVVLVSDSNVAVRPGYLADLAARLRPGVGLVSSLFRGVPAGDLGSELEGLQLNTFVSGGVAAVSELAGGVCVVGKSMLLRRSDLDALGGPAFLSNYLAEDQVCGEEIARRGLRVEVSGHVIENVLGPAGLRGFAARHVRWARIRRRMNPAAYAAEILLCPLSIGLAGAAILRTPGSILVFLGAWAVRGALDAAAERSLGHRRPPLSYPLLVLLRDLLVAALWPAGLVGRTVRWRGNAFRVGPRTLLAPLDTADAAAPGPQLAHAR